MRYILLFLITIPFSAEATRFADDVRSIDRHGDEVTVTFSSHNRVHRMKDDSRVIPCLENAFKAKKPVDVVVNDKDGNVLDCKLAPGKHPGAGDFN